MTIQEKCEQYWNAHNIGDAEIHAVLAFIHTKADESDDMQRELLNACEGMLYEFPNGNIDPLGNLTLGGALIQMRSVVAKAKGKK